ncbi:MAG: hypothetical protein K6C12_05990 [Oscillospiraceae bacterium]|nr:hypothetical protein [Oscillospiraceae bacterium]
MKLSRKKLLTLCLTILLIVSAVAVIGVQATAKEEYEPLPVGTVPYVDNDTAVRGDYTPYEPKEDAETFSGTAIEGNEEEELQQERIAGGAVGEARSQLEALHGITDYSEGDYVPVYGID